jgi:hypothetical protein
VNKQELFTYISGFEKTDCYFHKLDFARLEHKSNFGMEKGGG